MSEPPVVIVGFDGVAQGDVGATTEKLADLAAAVLAAEGVATPAEMGLVFVSSGVIAALNRDYRDKDGPTDVLSFAIDEEPARDGGPRLIGDVVVCPEIAARNAPDHARAIEAELELLVVHGVLHLLGWDHETDDDAARMESRERELLSLLAPPIAAPRAVTVTTDG